MKLELSPAQVEARRGFRAFVAEHVAPAAGQWDRQGELPLAAIELLRERGYLGAPLPRELGGGGLDAITYGLLTEELGRGCSSVRSLLTVHDMVGVALARWGSAAAKAEVLPRLARGERLAALALSEPEVGSDAAAVRTAARRDDESFVLDGRKKWITFGEVADELLVLARCEGELAAFLVPASASGVARRPLRSVVGTRASRLAEIELQGCRIGSERLLGRIGAGLSHVFATALDHGRYSVAWGAVGIAQACLDACLGYAADRRQFGVPLAEHQLVRRSLTEMIAGSRAARLLCYRAGYLREIRDPGAVPETMIAKYFASRTAVEAANDAVRLHGANGLSQDFAVERYLRDAKVTEIIEGSTEIQQISIPRYPLTEL
jgi:alkylation response protein AidB-like acyl-CoA dehydrogenase